MEIATQPSEPISRPFSVPSSSNAMSHGFYGYADGFQRSAEHGDHSEQHLPGRREKHVKAQGFLDPSESPLVPIGDYPPVYDPAVATSSGNMLSDMFNFPPSGPPAADLLHIPTGYRPQPPATVPWPAKHESQLLGMDADPAAAMRLFLMNPQQQGRRSASPPQHKTAQAILSHPALIHSASFGSSSSYAGGGGGLSLSLNSNLQRLEMAKAEGDLSVGDGMLYFHQQQSQQVNAGMDGPMGVAHTLRHSKYARAAQELLQEFCSVGRGQLKGQKRHRGSSSNPNPSSGHAGGGGVSGSGDATSYSKEPPVLSPSDRFEHQRRKAKLLAMLDEVDRRYSHYCEQMQAVVNSFDSVMGFGTAAPYTALAQRAMSRHFRCLKDSVAAQLRRTCEVLGEKDCSLSSGISKGETPRLRLLDQSLRQQRAFNQMGMMETEAWRPQRGLPERSVNVLRAWLFEHFLHPYPSDADKHLLSRQTGLSRNQVSNWFINARVRLWKPMVEEMYQQEAKEEEERSISPESSDQRPHSPTNPQASAAQNTSTSHTQPLLINNMQQFQHHGFSSSSSPSLQNSTLLSTYRPTSNVRNDNATLVGIDMPESVELCGFDMSTPDYGVTMVDPDAGRIRFGASGDVSLTLGLRHAGNMPESSRFSVRDFGGL